MNNEFSSDRFEYLNKEPLDKNFKCPICTYPLINPVSTNCRPESHTFCGNCIDQHVKINPSCPICKQELHHQDLKPETAVNFIRFLNNQQVKCLACEQTDLKRIDFDAHHKICPKVEVQCPSSDVGCSWKGIQDQLDQHLKNCIIDLIKPMITAFQNNCDQQQVTIIQLRAKIEQLMSEKNQLQETLKRSVTLPEWPKSNYQQRQVAEPGKVDTPINRDIIFPQAPSIFNKLDQNRIQVEGFIKENKQVSGGINQAVIQDTIKQMQRPLEKYLATDPGKTQESLTDRHTNQKYGSNPGGRTANHAYFPVHRAIPNTPIDTSGYGQPFPPSYFNANPSGTTAQNTLNHPSMEPFIIPISISISVNTNIVHENTGSNGGHTNNNIVGGNSISICAGNINIGDGCHNNIAGGSNNKIAGGNNYGCGGTNNNGTRRNNNPVAGINNAGGTVNNRDACDNNSIINGTGNNITGNGNNMAGGCDNSMVSGIIIIGGNSNTTAGGYNNYIASGNNSTYDDNNNNHNDRNDAPIGNGSENGTNNLGDHPNDERRSEISSIDVRLRENPDIVHPPDLENR